MATEVEHPLALGGPGPAVPVQTVSTPNSTCGSISVPTPASAGSNKNMSPTASNGTNSRRPPRKSTLTQQQKNQKRQRATQDQLATLELEFNKNPTPTATVRERIAEEINMTERSVQIWFQNRYVHLHTQWVTRLSDADIFQTCQDQAVGQEEPRDWRGH